MRTVLPQIVELYEIIADTIHTLTTSREPVLWRGAEWTPAAVERGELRGSMASRMQLDERQLTETCVASAPGITSSTTPPKTCTVSPLSGSCS